MGHSKAQKVYVSFDFRSTPSLQCSFHYRSCVLRYGLTQSSYMSVRFNQSGSHLLALQRRHSPVLFAVHSQKPLFFFDHPGYLNSCTMKSCCFGGENDQVNQQNVSPYLAFYVGVRLTSMSIFVMELITSRHACPFPLMCSMLCLGLMISISTCGKFLTNLKNVSDTLQYYINSVAQVLRFSNDTPRTNIMILMLIQCSIPS